jgi:peptidoglycan/xylan/chitin deacetylase (PgdA/CDA1 family)
MSLSIPILLYHRVDDSESRWSISTTPAVFRQHMQRLHEQGWKALSAQEFAYVASAKKSVPARTCVITFDDSYESVASAAFPILKEFGFHAICFLSTKLMRGGPCASGLSPAEEAAHLSWDQARELQASGLIDCQSHGHAHRNVNEMSAAELKHDLTTSIDILSDELRLKRRHFQHFAWPWGLSTAAGRAIAWEAGFLYQYTVARQSFSQRSPIDNIPRTCFDGADFGRFRRQMWLQAGSPGPVWNAAYPLARRLRHLSIG